MDEKRIVEEMDLWIRTGCVSQEYLRETLGDQSIAISPFRSELEYQSQNL